MILLFALLLNGPASVDSQYGWPRPQARRMTCPPLSASRRLGWAGLDWAGRGQEMVMGDHDAGNCGNGATAVTSSRGNNRVFI